MTESNLIASLDSEIDLSLFGEPLEVGELGPIGQRLFDYGTSRIIGQDRAWLKLARALTNYHSGIRPEPQLPIANFLLLGPTGVGKTESVNVLARYLIDPDSNEVPYTFINGPEYSKDHTVANLFGAPLGYKGSDKTGLLAQAKIDGPAFWAKMRKHPEWIKARAKGKLTSEYLAGLAAELYVETGPHLSVVVVDELEKAHPEVCNTFLNIMSRGIVTMSGEDGSQTHFNNSIIIFTGNVGGREQQEHKSHGSIGFDTTCNEEKEQKSDQEMYEITKRAAKATFSPEFLGRIGDEFIVFRSLKEEDVRRVADIRLRAVQKCVDSLPGGGPQLIFTEEFKRFIVEVGHNDAFGLRPLSQEIKRRVVTPLSVASEGGHIRPGTKLLFTVGGSKVGKKDTRHTEIRPAL